MHIVTDEQHTALSNGAVVPIVCQVCGITSLQTCSIKIQLYVSMNMPLLFKVPVWSKEQWFSIKTVLWGPKPDMHISVATAAQTIESLQKEKPMGLSRQQSCFYCANKNPRDQEDLTDSRSSQKHLMAGGIKTPEIPRDLIVHYQLHTAQIMFSN